MGPFEKADVLSAETFRDVLAASPFADRAERIRSTLREIHHQFLELKLTGDRTQPVVDYALLEEAAYYLSGVATTPGRSEDLAVSLRSQMLAVSALIFEYLGDIASIRSEATAALEQSDLYYLDACICNSLGLFEANAIALARKHLIRKNAIDDALLDPKLEISNATAQQILYAWLARDMQFLWLRRRSIDASVQNTLSDLRARLSDGTISRPSYDGARFWVALAEGIVFHARFFQFGTESFVARANEKFVYALDQAKRMSNPPLGWMAYAIQKCGDSMSNSSVWRRLPTVCPKHYIRRLVVASPPVLELWSSQIAALEANAQEAATGAAIPLDHGYLDPRVRRVVISMPTSAGKTLLAELAIVRTLFPDVASTKPAPDITCIYVVPSLALVNQIEAKLLSRLLPLGVRVTAVLGGYDVAQLDNTLFAQTRVAVVTPEKLDSLVRQDHPFVKQCGLFIFDEIHKIDSLGRGLTLEAIITWLKDFHPDAKRSKMLFMSAAMPNYLQIEMWVEDQDVPSGGVPVLSISESWQPTRQIKGFFEIDRNDQIDVVAQPPFTEYWYGGHLNYVSDRGDLAHPRQIRRLIKSKVTLRERRHRVSKVKYLESESKSSFGVEENAAEIAKRYVAANLYPVLVFFIKREETRTFCNYLAKSEDYSPVGLSEREQIEYRHFLEYLKDRLGGAHPLTEFAERGLAYHHGSLPRDVRAEIELAFSRGWIRVMASTTTLTDGVNFPIATFILADYQRVTDTKKRDWKVFSLEKKDFQNMIGRAGRAVYDTEGQIIFMVPTSAIPFAVPWQEYLFSRPDDRGRWILSSLNRPDFRRDILETIVRVLEDPAADSYSLAIDPDGMREQLGRDAKDVGETLLRLQTFLLSLMDREILDPENMDTVLRFFKRTLFGQQLPDDTLYGLVTRFAQRSGQLIVASQPDKQRRSAFGKVGLGFASCQALYERALRFSADSGHTLLDARSDYLDAAFLSELGSFIFSLPEVRPDRVAIPHTRPAKFLALPHGEILSHWVAALSPMSEIRETYFGAIDDAGERTEACAAYIRDAFEYKAPWVLSAFHLFVTNIAKTELGLADFDNTPLAHQLSMLPAYAKFGVNNPAAALFSMFGVSSRRMAILLGKQYGQENPDRVFDFAYMLKWIPQLEPERVAQWFEQEYGDDTSGEVPRLFRILDILRVQEQSLEEVLPLEIPVAGWRYYEGHQNLSETAVGNNLTLKLNPLNPWDANAVEVFDEHGRKLGYVPRTHSKAVRNYLVRDAPIHCTVSAIDPSDPYHPVTIRLLVPPVADETSARD